MGQDLCIFICICYCILCALFYECILYPVYVSIFRSSRKIDEREEAVYSYNSVHQG